LSSCKKDYKDLAHYYSDKGLKIHLNFENVSKQIFLRHFTVHLLQTLESDFIQI